MPTTIRIAVALAGVVALTTATPAGAAVERIQDGGFEASTCSTVDCTSGVWKETVNSGNGTGLICWTMIPDCGDNPATGSKWVLFATGSEMVATVSQTGISIPEAPAALRFKQAYETIGDIAALTVTLDGDVIYTDSDHGNIPYALKTIDVSRFADSGTHTLAFKANVDATGLTPVSVLVDDVSLESPTDVAPPSNATCKGKTADIVGTRASEVVAGTPRADVIVAGGGKDVVKAGGGNDLVCGGDGNDELRGKGGRDKLNGEAGKDKLEGGAGAGDVCSGGPGKDRAAGSCEKEKSA